MKRICSTLLAMTLCLSLATPTLAAEGQAVQVTQLNGRTVVDGTEVYFQLDEKESRSPLMYGNIAYIPLMAAGQWLGADAVYNEKSRSVSITHNSTDPIYYTRSELRKMGIAWHSWDIEGGGAKLCSDVTITVDGQTEDFANIHGEPLYPIQFQGYTLLPMEVITQLNNKQMMESTSGFATLIHLFDSPVQAEYDEAKTYLATVREHLNAVRAIVKGKPPKTAEEFTAKLREAQAHIKTVWTMPAPAFKGMAWFVENLRDLSELSLWEHIDPYLPKEENSGASPVNSEPKRMITWEPIKNDDGHVVYRPNIDKAPVFDLEKFWASFVDETIFCAEGKSDYTTYFLDLERACTDSDNFLAKVTPLPFTTDATAFTDAAQIQHWEAVATLTQLGVFNGKPDGSFDPTSPVTRGEAAKLMVVLAGNPEPSGDPVAFSDIDGHWAKPYIESCAQMGIISGRGDGTFDPDSGVSLYELAKMALVLIGYEAEEYHFTDSDWLSRVCSRAMDVGLDEGLTEGTPAFPKDGAGLLDNDTPITREKCAQLLYNALKAEPCPGKKVRGEDGKIVLEPTLDGTAWKYKLEPTKVFLFQEFQEAALPEVPAQPTAK